MSAALYSSSRPSYIHLVVAGAEIDSLVVHSNRFISVCAVINSWAQLDKPFSSSSTEEVLVIYVVYLYVDCSVVEFTFGT